MLPMHQHRSRRRDGRDDVDVSAGTETHGIARQSARQPDDMLRTDGSCQFRFDVGFRQPGVAARIELHGLGHQHRACAVDRDAAALVDHRRRDARYCSLIGDELADAAVLVPLRPVLCTPAVEDPVDGGDRTVLCMNECRADIAHPGVVQRCFDDVDVAREVCRCDGAFGRIDDDGHRLELGNSVRDGGPRRAGLVLGLRIVAEGVALARERHPHLVLRRGLGRHRERRCGGGHLITCVAACPSPYGASAFTGSVRRPYVSGLRVSRNGKSSNHSRR